jgi:hypothetical protein
VVIILSKELVGRKPPEEITVIARLKLLKNLIPDIENREKIRIVKKK